MDNTRRLRWFASVKYAVGTFGAFSANDIEHGILRANASSPASLGTLIGIPAIARRQFHRNDPRCELVRTWCGTHIVHAFAGHVCLRDARSYVAQVVSPLDPRIHFALVCGAKSCPPVRVFTPENLDAGLDAAAAAFCEGLRGRLDVVHEMGCFVLVG